MSQEFPSFDPANTVQFNLDDAISGVDAFGRRIGEFNQDGDRISREYNAQGLLVRTIMHDNNGMVGDTIVTHHYDAMGNRRAPTPVNVIQGSLTAGDTIHHYHYDAAGNRIDPAPSPTQMNAHFTP